MIQFLQKYVQFTSVLGKTLLILTASNKHASMR